MFCYFHPEKTPSNSCSAIQNDERLTLLLCSDCAAFVTPENLLALYKKTEVERFQKLLDKHFTGGALVALTTILANGAIVSYPSVDSEMYLPIKLRRQQ